MKKELVKTVVGTTSSISLHSRNPNL